MQRCLWFTTDLSTGKRIICGKWFGEILSCHNNTADPNVSLYIRFPSPLVPPSLSSVMSVGNVLGEHEHDELMQEKWGLINHLSVVKLWSRVRANIGIRLTSKQSIT